MTFSLRRAIKFVLACAVLLILFILLDLGCPIRAVFGIPCPGCGMTRAWLNFFRLDFGGAFAMHPLFLLAPVAALLASSLLNRHTKIRLGLAATIILAFVSAYVIRMVLLFPHTEPMTFYVKGLLLRLIAFFSRS